MPSTCSIRSLIKMSRRATSGPDLKTSFSRSNPRMRGQATSTRPSVRQQASLPNNRRSLTGMNPKGSSGSIFSSQYGQNRHKRKRRRANLNFQERQEHQLTPAIRHPYRAKPVADRSAPRPERSKRSLRQREDKIMVELSGIEPLTPCLQSRCSPS